MMSNKLNLEQLKNLTQEEIEQIINIFKTLSTNDFVAGNVRPCYLYLHLNKNNRKKYFGITTQKVGKRWKNGSSYSTNTHFYNSIQKYGWENFYHLVLCDQLTIGAAKRVEQLLIRCFNTTNPEYGYNKSIGGESGCKYYTTVEAETARKNTFLKSARKRYSNPETRKDVIAASSKYQRKIRENPEVVEQKRAIQRAVKQKVKNIRDQLRAIYSEQPWLFNDEQKVKAFGFKEDNKTYNCQSAKELKVLLEQICGGNANDK